MKSKKPPQHYSDTRQDAASRHQTTSEDSENSDQLSPVLPRRRLGVTREPTDLALQRFKPLPVIGCSVSLPSDDNNEYRRQYISETHAPEEYNYNNTPSGHNLILSANNPRVHTPRLPQDTSASFSKDDALLGPPANSLPGISIVSPTSPLPQPQSSSSLDFLAPSSSHLNLPLSTPSSPTFPAAPSYTDKKPPKHRNFYISVPTGIPKHSPRHNGHVGSFSHSPRSRRKARGKPSPFGRLEPIAQRPSAPSPPSPACSPGLDPYDFIDAR